MPKTYKFGIFYNDKSKDPHRQMLTNVDLLNFPCPLVLTGRK